MAQGPAITTPAQGQVFAAGPDFATDVLQDPWDFANVDDISQHPDEYLGWVQTDTARRHGRSAFLSGGRFVAQSNSNDAVLGLLYPGQAATVPTGRSGGQFPIETARYRKLSVKMTAPNHGGGMMVHWFFQPRGIDAGSTAFGPTPSGADQVIMLDLGSRTDGGSPYLSQPLARGLRLDPTSASNGTVSVDWVRLTAADGAAGAAMMPVQASGCSGGYTLLVIDAAGTPTTVASGASSSSFSASFNYGIFPPGTYTLRVACGSGSSDRAFVINDPTRVAVTAPSNTSGTEYATTVLGNPWDLEDAADVPAFANINPIGLVPAPSGGNMLRGTNISAPGNPGVQGDPNFFLLDQANNATPIATTKYRYLTFTMELEHPFDMAGGSVARIVYGSRHNFNGNTVTTTKDMLVLPGRNTYTIDMAALVPGDTLEPAAVSEPWALHSVRYLRFDPHEFGFLQVPFTVDNVSLTAPDQVTLGQPYTVRWGLADADAGGTRTVRVFLDADTNRSNGATMIGQGIPAAAGAFTWTAQNVGAGLYYVYVEVTDTNGGATNTQGAYSTGLLRVLQPGASNLALTLAAPQSNGTLYTGHNLGGCAYNPLATSGTGVDEVIAYATGGPTGTAVYQLGAIPEWGTPPATGLPCPGVGGQFANSAFLVSNIFGLAPGAWNFRVLARNTLTGDFNEIGASNVTVDWRSPPARNLRLAGVGGNTVTIAWDPPDGGRAVTAYRIEVATNPGFSPLAGGIAVPPNVTSGSGALPNGIWYVRVISESAYSTSGPPSNVIAFTLPGGGSPAPVAPPGTPTLQIVQAQANPVTLSWSAGSGGAPTQYLLHAGTTPGTSNIGVFDVSGHSSVTAAVPPGLPFYVRLVASNGAGSATSNEVSFTVGSGVPAAPSMHAPSVSGHDVFLSWNAAAGATSYGVIARVPGSPAIVAALPGIAGTSLHVPNVPSGVYIVTVVGVNGAGISTESNPMTVVVQ